MSETVDSVLANVVMFPERDLSVDERMTMVEDAVRELSGALHQAVAAAMSLNAS